VVFVVGDMAGKRDWTARSTACSACAASWPS
jgi:hypothetical protein